MKLEADSKKVRACIQTVAVAALLFLSTGCFDEQNQPRNLKYNNLAKSAIWRYGAGSAADSTPSQINTREGMPFGLGSNGYPREISGNDKPFAIYAAYPAGVKPNPIRLPESVSIGTNAGYAARTRAVSATPPPESAASLVFNKSFAFLFASIFKKGTEEAGTTADANLEENRNPFKEAKQKEDVKPADVSRKPAPATDNPPPPLPDSKPSPPPQSPVSTAMPADFHFVFLGDFDGSGILKAALAGRVDDTTFFFSDAQRVFNLFVNPSAVDQQRTVAIDDVNSDGLVDLLVTSRASLFGGVLLGDGSGRFRVADYFVTGYEPTIATFGSSVNGMRDIIDLDLNTGIATTFRAGGRYQRLTTQPLNFVPDHIGHLISPQDGQDYLMTGQGSNLGTVFRWRDGGRLEAASQSFPGDPSITLSLNVLSPTVTNVLQVYQVGSYASVVLSNGRGQSFNVANLKLWPGMFLAIGDLSSTGSLDIGVAQLVSSTPIQ